MTRTEAQSILSACRPHDLTAAPAGSDVAKAAAMLAADAELRAWWERHNAFDNAFTRKLQMVEVPAGLAQKILSQHAARTQPAPVAKTAAPASGKVIPFWRQPLTWSIAACVVAMLALGVVLITRPHPLDSIPPVAQTTERVGNPELAAFMTDVARHAVSFGSLELFSSDPEEVRAFLASHGTPLPRAIPANLENLPRVGCITAKFNGVPVSMICFRGDQFFHFYIADRNQLAAMPLGETPTVEQLGEVAVATWAQEDRVYAIASQSETCEPVRQRFD